MSFDFEKYAPHWDWSETVLDDAKAIGALMGFDIDRVYFTGFWSQGDGACFEGTFHYVKGCAAAVKTYAPQNIELHRIATAWQELQRKCFYQLRGSVRHRGHYYHEMATSFEWENGADSRRALPDSVEDDATEIARDFMRWIYDALEREYEYQQAWELARGWQELAHEMAQSRANARQLVRDMRAAIRSGISAAPSICSALRAQLRAMLSDWEQARDERAEIESHFSYWDNGNAVSIEQFAIANL